MKLSSDELRILKLISENQSVSFTRRFGSSRRTALVMLASWTPTQHEYAPVSTADVDRLISKKLLQSLYWLPDSDVYVVSEAGLRILADLSAQE